MQISVQVPDEMQIREIEYVWIVWIVCDCVTNA